MALYAIGDLHLSFQTDKPMDIFGDGWTDYEKILEKKWQESVTKDDTVVLVGDISWATYLAQAVEDFAFLNRLNGKKIILKGNHDYWWETRKKMHEFLQDNNFSNIDFLYNNSFEVDGINICGTKGYDEKEDDEKIIRRELSRFELSYKSILDKSKKTFAFFHYPPQGLMVELLEKYEIELSVFGHLHGLKKDSYKQDKKILVSCDYVNFQPILLSK